MSCSSELSPQLKIVLVLVLVLTTPNRRERRVQVAQDPVVMVEVDDEVLRLVPVRDSVLLHRV